MCIYKKCNMKNVIISARINKKIVEECRKLEINISEIIREVLLQKVYEKKEEMFRKSVEEASKITEKLNIKNVVKDIRQMREER